MGTPKASEKKIFESTINTGNIQQTDSGNTFLPPISIPCKYCPKYEETVKQLETKYESLQTSMFDLKVEYNRILESSKSSQKEREKEKEKENAALLEKTKMEQQFKDSIGKLQSEIKSLKEQVSKISSELNQVQEREIGLEKQISEFNEKLEEELHLKEADLKETFDATMNRAKLQWEEEFLRERSSWNEKRLEMEQLFEVDLKKLREKIIQLESILSSERSNFKDKEVELVETINTHRTQSAHREAALVRQLSVMQQTHELQIQQLEEAARNDDQINKEEDQSSEYLNSSVDASETNSVKQKRKSLITFAMDELKDPIDVVISPDTVVASVVREQTTPNRAFTPNLFGIGNTTGIIKARMESPAGKSSSPPPVKLRPKQQASTSPPSHYQSQDPPLRKKDQSFYDDIDGSTYLQMEALDDERQQRQQFSREEQRFTSPTVKISKNPSVIQVIESFQKEQLLNSELADKNQHLKTELDKLQLRLSSMEQASDRKEKVLNLKLKESSLLLQEFSSQTTSLRKELKAMTNSIQKLSTDKNVKTSEGLPKIKVIDLNSKATLSTSLSDSVLPKHKLHKKDLINQSDKYLFRDAMSDET